MPEQMRVSHRGAEASVAGRFMPQHDHTPRTHSNCDDGSYYRSKVGFSMLHSACRHGHDALHQRIHNCLKDVCFPLL